MNSSWSCCPVELVKGSRKFPSTPWAPSGAIHETSRASGNSMGQNLTFPPGVRLPWRRDEGWHPAGPPATHPWSGFHAWARCGGNNTFPATYYSFDIPSEGGRTPAALPHEVAPMRVTLLALLLTAVPGTALAQSNVALMANDHYTRSTTTIWFTSGSRCGISTGTRCRSRAASPRRWWRCGRASTRSSSTRARCSRTRAVKDRRGPALRTDPHGDTLVVFPAEPRGVRRHADVHESPTTAR